MEVVPVLVDDLRLLLKTASECHDGDGCCDDDAHKQAMELMAKYGFAKEFICQCGHLLAYHEFNRGGPIVSDNISFDKKWLKILKESAENKRMGWVATAEDIAQQEEKIASGNTWKCSDEPCYRCMDELPDALLPRVKRTHCTKEQAHELQRKLKERCGIE